MVISSALWCEGLGRQQYTQADHALGPDVLLKGLVTGLVFGGHLRRSKMHVSLFVCSLGERRCGTQSGIVTPRVFPRSSSVENQNDRAALSSPRRRGGGLSLSLPGQRVPQRGGRVFLCVILLDTRYPLFLQSNGNQEQQASFPSFTVHSYLSDGSARPRWPAAGARGQTPPPAAVTTTVFWVSSSSPHCCPASQRCAVAVTRRWCPLIGKRGPFGEGFVFG